MYVDDIKLAGKTENIDPMWKVLWKTLILENQHHFLTMYFWAARKDIVDNYSSMFESRISAGATEKLPETKARGNLMPKRYMEGHAKKCVDRYCELANKTTEQ